MGGPIYYATGSVQVLHLTIVPKVRVDYIRFCIFEFVFSL